VIAVVLFANFLTLRLLSVVQDIVTTSAMLFVFQRGFKRSLKPLALVVHRSSEQAAKYLGGTRMLKARTPTDTQTAALKLRPSI